MFKKKTSSYYYITKDEEDGKKEVVAMVKGSEDDARKRFNEIVNAQIEEYHVLKTLDKWRVIRLFDSEDRQIAQEG
ncbi:MAG: hypothetical protein J1F39_05620 [Clostridiales bacterium]|nr:hypothetical protein [Clostridiales bacterium]